MVTALAVLLETTKCVTEDGIVVPGITTPVLVERSTVALELEEPELADCRRNLLPEVCALEGLEIAAPRGKSPELEPPVLIEVVLSVPWAGEAELVIIETTTPISSITTFDIQPPGKTF